MKKLIVLFVLFASSVSGQTVYKYFIRFTDKNNSPYSFSNPLAFLSQRAMDRRSAQGIALDSLDFPVNPQYVDAIRNLNVPVFARSKWFNGIVVACDSVQLSQITALPFVFSANKVTRVGAPVRPSKFETTVQRQYRMSSGNSGTSLIDYGAGRNQINMIRGDYLHDEGFTGAGMVIAMLDAGFSNADQISFFNPLYNRNGVLSTWDFVDGHASVYEDDGHGMVCMSTIVSDLPGLMVGTAPDASFILLRTEDVFSEYIVEEYNWAAGAEYADSAGADLISASLGYSEFDDPAQNHTYADMDGKTCPASVAANIAARKGILPVVSAGNLGLQLWRYISAPGDADSALTAGGVDAFGVHAAFSSFGPSADGDIKPNVVTQGLSAAVIDPFNNISAASGTSFSCPILAGAAACLWQRYPSKTNMEILHAIEQSAHLYTTPNDSMGYGIPNFQSASFILSTTDPDNENDMINVYPNPFSDRLFVSVFTKRNESSQVRLTDMLGKTLLSRTIQLTPGMINTFTLDQFPEMADGIYILNVMTGTESRTIQLVKNH